MSRFFRVVPAILTDDEHKLSGMLQQAATFTDYVQIDIMDGKFVPSHSITWEQIRDVPQTLRWEVHLMVEQPEKQLASFKQAGAFKAIFHFEAATNPGRVITRARELGLAVGLAINPETAIEQILSLTSEVDSVLFLSVHPGFYNAKFIPEVLDKITVLRQLCPQLELGIDGGIKDNNINAVAKKGVNEICVGSAIFMQPDPGTSYRKLLSLANGD